MVLPLLPIALALTAGGIGARYMGAQQAQDATNDALAAERIRQEGFDQEARKINTRGRERYQDIAPQREAKASELADLFLGGADDAPSFGPPPSADSITVRKETDAKAKARDYTDRQGRARADMLSFGDLFGDIGVEQARDMTELNGIMGMRRGSQGVLPLELDAAAQEGGGWRLAGDIMSGLGSVASMGALTGAQLPGLGGILSTNAPRSAVPWLSRATNPGPFQALRGLL